MIRSRRPLSRPPAPFKKSSDKQTFEYGGYNDRIIKTSLYDSGTLSGSNEITYENGRIRTVSDGYSKAKYGQKHDFVNDKVEYTRFNEDIEEVVQTDTIRWDNTSEIYRHTSKFSNSGVTLMTTLDKYNRITHISESDGSVARYTYQDGDESKLAQKVSKLKDNFELMTTEYCYDAYNNLCGWKKGDGHLEVQQIAAGTTKYTFGGNEKYFCSVGYDSNKILSPRITSTTIYRDPDEDADDDVEEIKQYTRDYEYDSLGRLVRKKGEYTTTILTNTSFHKSEEFTDYLKVGQSDTNIPKSRSYYTNYRDTTSIISPTDETKFDENYEYDENGNLKKINNVIKYTETSLVEKVLFEKSQTKSYGYDNLNRLISENDSVFGNRTYTYSSNGKPSKVVVNGSTRYYTYNTLNQLTSYNGNTYTYDKMGNREKRKKGSITTRYNYTRGNLLSSITNIANYSYNCDGVRYKKERPGGNITTYYLDGAKILGEDRKDSNGNTVRLRYFYDIDGLCGIKYNDTYYECARNAYGDIMLITSGSSIVARYEYDAWGNYKVFDYQGNEDNDANSIGNINPFRWKGHYFDTESGLYYANGSYYDPEVGLHVDAMPVSSLIENAFKVFCDFRLNN